MVRMICQVSVLLSLLPTMVFAEGEESAGAATTATRITDVSTLKVDDQIVIANAAAEYALGTNQKTNNREAVVVTASGSSITLNSKVQVLTCPYLKAPGVSASESHVNKASHSLHVVDRVLAGVSTGQ